jgi:hypothetical protein
MGWQRIIILPHVCHVLPTPVGEKPGEIDDWIGISLTIAQPGVR